VATHHAALVSALGPEGGRRAEIAAVVTPTPPATDVASPVPVHYRTEGTKRQRFLAGVLERVQPDVVLLHHIATAYALALGALAPDLPLVGFAHSWHPFTYAAPDRREKVRRRTERALASLRALVCCSEHCRREGVALGFALPGRTEVIHYPIHPAFAAPAPAAEDGRAGRRGVVFLGDLIARKDPAALVRAAALVDDLPVTLLGGGPELGELLSEAGRLGVADRVAVPAAA